MPNKEHCVNFYNDYADDSNIASTQYACDYQQIANKKRFFTKKSFIILTSIILAIVIAISAYVISLFVVKKQYITVESFENMSEPIQTEYIADDNVVKKKFGNANVEITLVAEYKIVGRVVSTQYYVPYKTINRLSRYDIGIAWGPLSGHEYDNYIKFWHRSDRGLRTSYTSKLYSYIDEGTVSLYFSNNHMIHSNDYILKCLRNVKKDQYIMVEGYLCNVFINNGYSYGEWNSSLVRTDSGANACEVVYVTNITWVEMK